MLQAQAKSGERGRKDVVNFYKISKNPKISNIKHYPSLLNLISPPSFFCWLFKWEWVCNFILSNSCSRYHTLFYFVIKHETLSLNLKVYFITFCVPLRPLWTKYISLWLKYMLFKKEGPHCLVPLPFSVNFIMADKICKFAKI